VKNSPEFICSEIWDELVITKAVIVTSIGVESSNVRKEFLEFFISDSFCGGCCF